MKTKIMPQPMSDEDIHVLEMAVRALDPSKRVHMDPYDVLALISRAKGAPMVPAIWCHACEARRTFNRFDPDGAFVCVVCGTPA